MTKIDDSEIRRKVLAELDWDPSIDASAVGVAVKDGVVTLTGSIETCNWRQGGGRRSDHQVAWDGGT